MAESNQNESSINLAHVSVLLALVSIFFAVAGSGSTAEARAAAKAAESVTLRRAESGVVVLEHPGWPVPEREPVYSVSETLDRALDGESDVVDLDTFSENMSLKDWTRRAQSSDTSLSLRKTFEM
ncbi:MAG: hypothetical protein AAF517_24625, partial [Planctomycetota bacterium]